MSHTDQPISQPSNRQEHPEMKTQPKTFLTYTKDQWLFISAVVTLGTILATLFIIFIGLPGDTEQLQTIGQCDHPEVQELEAYMAMRANNTTEQIRQLTDLHFDKIELMEKVGCLA